MIILWGLWSCFPDGILVTFITIWLKDFPQVSGRTLTSRSADSLWNAVSDGNSTSCLQSCTVCSALWSLHPFILSSFCAWVSHLQHWNNYICHLFTTQEFQHKAFKSTTKGWGGIRLIKLTMLFCKSEILMIFVYL